jgi:hypothetical protein
VDLAAIDRIHATRDTAWFVLAKLTRDKLDAGTIGQILQENLDQRILTLAKK